MWQWKINHRANCKSVKVGTSAASENHWIRYLSSIHVFISLSRDRMSTTAMGQVLFTSSLFLLQHLLPSALEALSLHQRLPKLLFSTYYLTVVQWHFPFSNLCEALSLNLNSFCKNPAMDYYYYLLHNHKATSFSFPKGPTLLSAPFPSPIRHPEMHQDVHLHPARLDVFI